MWCLNFIQAQVLLLFIRLSDHEFFVWLKHYKTFDDKHNFYYLTYSKFSLIFQKERNLNWKPSWMEKEWMVCSYLWCCLEKLFSFSCWPELGARWPCFSSFFPGFFTTTVKASRAHRARAYTALLSSIPPRLLAAVKATTHSWLPPSQ